LPPEITAVWYWPVDDNETDRKSPLGYVDADVVNFCVGATVPKLASNPPLPVRVVTFVGDWKTVAAVAAAAAVQFCPSLETTMPPLLPPPPPATNWTPDPPTTARLYCEFVATLPTCVENAAALSV
jgi:hypothetical protein